MTPRTFAVIWWHDAHGTAGAKSESCCRPWLKVSAGFVIDETDEAIEIAQEINEDGSTEYNATILKSMVRGISYKPVPRDPKGWAVSGARKTIKAKG